ncbi:hypothetical protein OR1_03358 [Geobacter sp. OR-1]|nr:hypothetical protein OR1_03358 [Geobacter sp. OR-1]
MVAEGRKLPEIVGGVSRLSGDLIELILNSRLPVDTSSTDTEYLLELRSVHLGSAFRCRALLVSDASEMTVSMRLVGNVILEELREYFRIDTYIPLRYIPLADLDEKTVLRRWLEFLDFQTQRSIRPASFAFKGEPASAASSDSDLFSPLEYSTPVAANISGGGLRTNLPELLKPGCQAILEMYLPGTPPRIVDVVGEVLASGYVHSEDGGKTFSTPFKFTHINENDRDAIINHIHKVQQQQIRQISDETPVELRTTAPSPLSRNARIKRFIGKTIVISLLIITALFLFNLYKHRGKSEVSIIFERGLKMYLDRIFSTPP